MSSKNDADDGVQGVLCSINGESKTFVFTNLSYNDQSGGFAGLTADLVLFPLDTIKTRLQSRQGFQAAGGFNRVYAGLAPTAAGSAPSGIDLRNRGLLIFMCSQLRCSSVRMSWSRDPLVRVFQSI